MAFRATVVAVEQAFDRLRQQAINSKQYLTQQRAQMVTPTVASSTVISTIQHLGQVVTLMNGWAATPGLAQYAKDQVADQAYDVVAEFTAMRNAMVSARDNLIAAFPKDGSNFLLYQTLNVDGSIAFRTFTAAQVASAVALIDSVIAAIS